VRVTSVALLAACLIPSVSGQQVLFGSELLPELSDKSDDVEYSPAYTGTRDLDYLDLNAAWFSYDNATDEISLTLRNAGAEGLESASLTTQVQCSLVAEIVKDNETQGELRFEWTRHVNSDVLDSDLWWVQEAGPETTTRKAVPHGFNATLETPAYFTFTNTKFELTRFGDQAEKPRAACVESVNPPDPPGGLRLRGTGYPVASDEAASSAAYSFVDTRRVRSPDGVLDPIEKFERAPTAAAENVEEPSPQDTPGFTPTAFAVAMILVGIVRRRARSPP
jgi:hypothetical protein